MLSKLLLKQIKPINIEKSYPISTLYSFRGTILMRFRLHSKNTRKYRLVAFYETENKWPVKNRYVQYSNYAEEINNKKTYWLRLALLKNRIGFLQQRRMDVAFIFLQSSIKFQFFFCVYSWKKSFLRAFRTKGHTSLVKMLTGFRAKPLILLELCCQEGTFCFYSHEFS